MLHPSSPTAPNASATRHTAIHNMHAQYTHDNSIKQPVAEHQPAVPSNCSTLPLQPPLSISAPSRSQHQQQPPLQSARCTLEAARAPAAGHVTVVPFLRAIVSAGVQAAAAAAVVPESAATAAAAADARYAPLAQVPGAVEFLLWMRQGCNRHVRRQ